MRLNGAGLTSIALGQIEDDGMGMELWRDIPIDGPSRIMFKLCRDEFASGLRRIVASDAGLRVMLQLFEGHANAFPVGLPNTIIAANQRGE